MHVVMRFSWHGAFEGAENRMIDVRVAVALDTGIAPDTGANNSQHLRYTFRDGVSGDIALGSVATNSATVPGGDNS